MDRIRQAADVSVLRGLSFTALAICAVMSGLIFDLLLAVKAGAALVTLTALVLWQKSFWAPHRDFRKTEIWILLDRRHGLPEAFAQRVIGGVLHDVYLHYAGITAAIAAVLWLLALGLWLRH